MRIAALSALVVLCGCVDSKLPVPAPAPPVIPVFADTPCPDAMPVPEGKSKDPWSFDREFDRSLLHAYGEPCLEAEMGEEAYQFTWVRTFDPALVVRIVRTRSGVYAVAKTGPVGRLPHTSGGYGVVAYGPVRVSDEAWRAADDALRLADFWSLPSDERAEMSDGAVWHLEGARSGNRHEVWTQSGGRGAYVRFRDACVKIVKAAGVTIDPKRIY